MPKAIIYVGLVLLILALIPPALIARTRAVHSDKRRIHLVQDMDNQGKFRAQAPAPQLFADGRARCVHRWKALWPAAISTTMSISIAA